LPHRAPSGRVRPDAHSFRDLAILLLPALVFVIVVSSKTGMNEHMRYILPAFPFVFIGVAGIFGILIDNDESTSVDCRCVREVSCRATYPLLVFLLLWSIVSSCWTFPHSLSYFSEAVGGPLNGSKHLLGSNVDWGQDLLYVKSASRELDVRVACLAMFDPRDVGLSGLAGGDQLERGDLVAASKSLLNAPVSACYSEDHRVLNALKQMQGACRMERPLTYAVDMLVVTGP
jgi:hypothetical protein